jgi:TonB family protein
MATQPTDTTKPRLRTLSDELSVIAQRAQAFTNASGTAIALSEGNADEIVCRARSGSAAPEVGAVLRVEGSFTGLCIQTGKELRCDDAETDTRVDTAAIRALGIRSMVVTPIRDELKVVGVLACFAPTAHAFTITHVAVLKTMADQISILLQKERRSREEGTQADAPLPMPKPVASAPTPLPAPVVIKPAAFGTATAAAPARVPAVAKVEPVKTDAAAPVPFPKREEKQKPEVKSEAKSEVKASFGTFDSVAAEDKKSGGSKMVFAAVAVLVVAAISIYFVMKTRKPSAVVPAQQAQQTNANGNSGQMQTAGIPASTTTSESATSVSQPVAGSSHSAEKPVSVAENNRKKEAKPEHVSAKESKSTDEQEKAEKPAPATVAVSSGGPSRLSASIAEPQTVQISPTLSMTTGSATLSSLARPVASGTPSVAIAQSDLEPMHVLKTVPPMYPSIARIRRLSGSVVVQVTVGKDGKVHNPQLVSGQPVFRDAAFDAVKQWKFKPAMLNGQPIDQTTEIKMDFKP